MRILTSVCICLALVVCLGTVTESQATTLATTGYAFNNGAGPGVGGAWQGSETYSAVLINTLDADVEFAVFAPGDFQDFLDENGIIFADPAPAEYIYAYQVVRVGGTGVTNFSVGLDGNEQLGAVAPTYIPAATNYGTYSPAPVQDPSTVGGGPGISSSSVWHNLPGYLPGEASDILFYSSPDVPELGYSTVAVGVAAQQKALSLPNPVPEPVTALLAVSGSVIVCMSSLRRRGRS